jgi:hypothetical protein
MSGPLRVAATVAAQTAAATGATPYLAATARADGLMGSTAARSSRPRGRGGRSGRDARGLAVRGGDDGEDVDRPRCGPPVGAVRRGHVPVDDDDDGGDGCGPVADLTAMTSRVLHALRAGRVAGGVFPVRDPGRDSDVGAHVPPASGLPVRAGAGERDGADAGHGTRPRRTTSSPCRGRSRIGCSRRRVRKRSGRCGPHQRGRDCPPGRPGSTTPPCDARSSRTRAGGSSADRDRRRRTGPRSSATRPGRGTTAGRVRKQQTIARTRRRQQPVFVDETDPPHAGRDRRADG